MEQHNLSAARQILTEDRGWTITGDTEDCDGTAPDLVASDDHGHSNADDITNETEPTFALWCNAADSSLRLTVVDGGSPREIASHACDRVGATTVTVAASALDGSGGNGEGTWTLQFTEVGAGGGESTSSTLDVTVDLTPPPADFGWLHRMPDVLSDPDQLLIGGCNPESDFAEIETSPAGGLGPHPITAELTGRGSFSLADLDWADGDYDLIIRCFDRAGNGPGTITIDSAFSVSSGG